MARQLLQSHHHLPSLLSSATPPLLLLLVVAAIASVILSLCTTRKHTNISKLRSKLPSPPPPPSSTSDRKLVGKLSGLGSKAMVVAKMVSWTRGGDREEVEEAVWRKSILMGEKCRPLNFSGKIVYDEEGNEVKEVQTRVVDGGK